MDNLFKIVNYLGKHYMEEFTMHQLSKILSIPYATFYRVIKSKENLFEIKNIGRSKVLKLSRENSIIHSYLAISSETEKCEFINSKPLIRIIEKDLNTHDIVILFGSFAKGTDTKRSDIDIIVINKKGEKSISFSKHETLMDREINSMFFKEKEFISMLKDKDENVGKQALKDHIILNNPKRFWEVVLDSI